jgi:hypothetical protein
VAPILVVVITAVFVGYLIYYSRSHRERLAARRHANALPELSGGNAGAPITEGAAVRVVGAVRAVQPLESPISGQQCVAYRVRVKVDQYEVPGAQPIDDAFTTQFMIDRPGEPPVIVDGSHVRLDVRPQTRETYDGARAERYFQMRGLPIRAVLGSDIEETVVLVGARVMVAGSVLLDGGTPGGGMIRLAGNAHQPLVIASV